MLQARPGPKPLLHATWASQSPPRVKTLPQVHDSSWDRSLFNE